MSLARLVRQPPPLFYYWDCKKFQSKTPHTVDQHGFPKRVIGKNSIFFHLYISYFFNVFSPDVYICFICFVLLQCFLACSRAQAIHQAAVDAVSTASYVIPIVMAVTRPLFTSILVLLTPIGIDCLEGRFTYSFFKLIL